MLANWNRLETVVGIWRIDLKLGYNLTLMTLDLSLNREIVDYWPEIESAATENGLDINLLKKAYDFAANAHLGQFRESGEPYISHPAWVAKTVAQMGVGQEAVIASLLHDIVEDTSITLEDISDNFGDEVALLVEGMTEVKRKTSGIEILETNIEVFRRFLFSSVNDVRVLIIRLADKLHNGLTISALTRERQIKYAKRVFGIYGPVAEYVGLHFFKRQLEDIAFKIMYPEEAELLQKTIDESAREEMKALALIKEDITKMLQINNIHKYELQGRIKSLYSSYLKTKNYGLKRGLKDRVGLRVLVSNVADCYTVLGLIHSKYPYIVDEFKDYISTPKLNGYRSIQTTFKWKKNVSVEIQIRTYEMHEFNEFGPASHLAYKMGNGVAKGVGVEWVRDLIKWQRSDNNVNNYRIKVLTKYIYVFTPKGDIIQLPSGATALDFAYRIHTDLGDYCSGVKVNSKMSKIDNVLETGDIVEIQTTKKINVNKNWLTFLKTSFAKEHVRKMVSTKNGL